MKQKVIIAVIFLFIGVWLHILFDKKHIVYETINQVLKREKYIKNGNFGGYCTSSNTEILKNGFSYCLKNIDLKLIKYWNPSSVEAIYRGYTKDNKIVCELILSWDESEPKFKDYCNLTAFYKKNNIKIGNAHQYMIDRKREAEKNIKNDK